MSNSLNNDEYSLVQSSTSGEIQASAVARLYNANGSSWSYSGLWGAAILVQDKGTSFLRLISLADGTTSFEQELYDNFEYQSPTGFFHTFEGADSVCGLSFADENDASSIFNAVTNAAASLASSGGYHEPVKGPAPAPPTRPGGPPPRPAAPIPSMNSPREAPSAYASSTPAPYSAPSTPPPSYAPSPSTPAPYSSPPAVPAPYATPSPAPAPSIPAPTTATPPKAGSGIKKTDNKKEKGSSRFGAMFKKVTNTLGIGDESNPGDNVVLSGPVSD